ncbi:hypothetical protein GCK32_021837, partial [Trichostrongylus colubriformis]
VISPMEQCIWMMAKPIHTKMAIMLIGVSYSKGSTTTCTRL